MEIKKLIIRGEKETVPSVYATPNLQPEESYNLTGVARDIGNTHTIDIKNNDKLLEFVFDDETTWMCDAATLYEIFPEVEKANRDADDVFEIPGTISSADGQRGIFGKLALKILNVFSKKAIPGGVGKIAGKLEDKFMADGEGLLSLDKDFKLRPFDNSNPRNPYLLFIHGTNSNTQNAFNKLEGSDVWKFIHSTYRQNVIAFQHRTLTKSPLQNVLDLAGQLPDEAELHIISHSRGGIVGDILCRYSLNSDNRIVGFVDENINLLKKEGNREDDIECIKLLSKAFSKKKISVKKYIRVACPAAGTKLASKRLHTILNAFFNLVGGKLNPVSDIIKELIAETIRTKDDVGVLPGIEAQNPDSPFIKVLNDRHQEVAIDGNSLAVISGNGKVSLSLNGLVVILSRLFYAQRNDLVVNTDSMYLGANRKGKIQYFFDQGDEVSHVKYFLNSRTQQAIGLALKAANGEPITGYTSVEQYEVPASARGDLRGLEHGELHPFPGIPTGKKPMVILLPGIMGSNLEKSNDKVWLAYLKMVFGGLLDLEHIDDISISAPSVIKSSYKQLATRLLGNYDVIVYPFDWRRQLNDCAKDFNDRIVELLKYNQPIKIIGHSMGGVLVRDFIINHDSTWKQLNASKDFRIIFLGSPLGGSFRIPTVLFGYDGIINSLNMLDRRHTKKELLQMFRTFPGILSLLPITQGDKYDFADPVTWKKMADAFGDTDWPLPLDEDLEVFKEYRNNILAKRDAIDYTNMVYIAGKDKATACDYYNDTIPPRTELVFLYTGEGDASVTWESGIPKQMPEKNVYYTNVTHGALANEPDIFEGIEDILKKGTTSRLSHAKPMVRGEDQVFRMTETYNFDLSEKGIKNAVFGITEQPDTPSSAIPVSASVSNGDLAYASYPVMAGHFVNDGILYAEKSIDNNLNGNLSARHHVGIYPGEIGTHTVALTNSEEGDFPGAIIVGLGEPGKLTSYQLTKTVEQGVCQFLIDVNGQHGPQKEIGISSIIIGCGYGGLTIESSVMAIIEAVNNANKKILKELNAEAKIVQTIEFIELYENKALSCLYALSKLETTVNSNYNIRIARKKIKQLFGSRKRLPVNSTDEWWSRMTVRHEEKVEDGEKISTIVFSASTGDAREEEVRVFDNTGQIDLFIEQVSTKNKWSIEYARALFEMMIPNQFKENLKRKRSIYWILDKKMAGYPWELLQGGSNEASPLCINAGMVRQLATPEFRQNIKRVATDMALVVGDPELSGFITQLPGAKKEGLEVERLLNTNGFQNIALINKTAAEIYFNLAANDYKIIHLAGHGLYNAKSRARSGMVIGNEIFLTTAHIEQMSSVPELVFVNCCHLGKVDDVNEKYSRDRYKLAANIGTQLIEIGVKAVVAAGWAVDDTSASDFARVFYTKMFEGYNFGDAVRSARGYIYEQGQSGNTWGAYQCYGDPFYRLINRSVARSESTPNYIIKEEAEIALNNLRNVLDTRALTSQQCSDKLKLISEGISNAEIGSGEILEQEAIICYELGEYESFINKFETLKKFDDANFSVSALEKYCNARGKKCVIDFKAGIVKTGFVNTMNAVITDLNKLLELQATSERNNLIGSAYKRKGMVSSTANAKLSAYNMAATFYQTAFKIKQDAYSLNNWITFQTIIDLAKNTPAKQVLYDDKTKAEMIQFVLDRKSKLDSAFNNMDYWELVEDICYDLSLLLMDDEKAKDDANWKNIEKRYKRLWKNSGSKGRMLTEIENLEIIADALSLAKSKHVVYLKAKINILKQELENILSE